MFSLICTVIIIMFAYNFFHSSIMNAPSKSFRKPTEPNRKELTSDEWNEVLVKVDEDRQNGYRNLDS